MGRNSGEAAWRGPNMAKPLTVVLNFVWKGHSIIIANHEEKQHNIEVVLKICCLPEHYSSKHYCIPPFASQRWISLRWPQFPCTKKEILHIYFNQSNGTRQPKIWHSTNSWQHASNFSSRFWGLRPMSARIFLTSCQGHEATWLLSWTQLWTCAHELYFTNGQITYH